MLPPLEFLIEGTKKALPFAVIFSLVFLVFGIIGFLIMPLTPIYIILAGIVIYYFLLDKQVTRRQLVFRTGEHDEIYLDEQKWWKEIADKYPDGAKHIHKNQRIGIWHVEDNKIREFDVWKAPPDPDSVPGSEVGNINALMYGASEVIKEREETFGEKLQMGMFVILIIGCLLGVIMAVGQLTDNEKKGSLDDNGVITEESTGGNSSGINSDFTELTGNGIIR